MSNKNLPKKKVVKELKEIGEKMQSLSEKKSKIADEPETTTNQMKQFKDDLDCLEKEIEKTYEIYQKRDIIMNGEIDNLKSMIGIFEYCCDNPLGVLHPKIGLSENSLSWFKALKPILIGSSQPSLNNMKKLSEFLKNERNSGKKIFPEPHLVWRFTEFFKIEDTKVVILGQEPYPYSQNDGLAFSTGTSNNIPESLKKIYDALKTDLKEKFKRPNRGDLSRWAEQGVLLMDTYLTVEQGKPLSHSDKNLKQRERSLKGWSHLTGEILKYIGKNCHNVVFMLWGEEAKNLAFQKDRLPIQNEKEKRGFLYLESCHPVAEIRHQNNKSKFKTKSGQKGKPLKFKFEATKCNQHLREKGLKGIEWNLPERSGESRSPIQRGANQPDSDEVRNTPGPSGGARGCTSDPNISHHLRSATVGNPYETMSASGSGKGTESNPNNKKRKLPATQTSDKNKSQSSGSDLDEGCKNVDGVESEKPKRSRK